MKNYYLRRIDELKTEIGSDRNSRTIASAIRAFGTGGAVKLANAASRSGPQKRRGGPEDREGDSEGTLVRRTPTPHRRGLGNRTTRTSETGTSSKNAAMKAAGEVAAKNAAIKAAREVQDQNAAIKAAGKKPTNTADKKPKFGAGLSTDAKPIGRPSRGNIGPVSDKPQRDFSKFGAGIPTRDELKAQRVKRRRADFAASQARKAGTASDVAAAKFRVSQDRKAGSAETSDLKAKFQNLSTGSGNKARRRIKQIGADRIAKFKAAMDQKRKDASATRAFRGRVLRYNRIGNTERGTNEPNSTTRKRTQRNPVDDR